jgi:hypothetical protein
MLVPGGFGEHHAHAAPIGDTSEGQASADKCGDSIVVGMNPCPENDTGQNQQASGNPNLSLK